MRGALILCVAGLALAGCATNTKGSWACKAPEGATCASIEEIDRGTGAGASGGVVNAAARTTIEGAEVVRWWKNVPLAAQGPGFPLREGDQVMRVVFAPFVDRAGDYYTRSEVYAVMRPGGWWAPGAAPEAFVVKPLPEAASPRSASK